MIHHHSHCRNPLKDFLVTQLQGASRCERIAGFFSSSLQEMAIVGNISLQNIGFTLYRTIIT